MILHSVLAGERGNHGFNAQCLCAQSAKYLLYAAFLQRRLSPSWDENLGEIRRWVKAA